MTTQLVVASQIPRFDTSELCGGRDYEEERLNGTCGIVLVYIVVASAFTGFTEPVATATIATVQTMKAVGVSQTAAAQDGVIDSISGYICEADGTVTALSFTALQPRAKVKDNPADGVESSSLEAANKAGGSTYVPDEIPVKFKPGAADIIKTNLFRKHGSNLVKEFTPVRVYCMRLKEGLSVEEAIKKYKANPNAEYAELNYIDMNRVALGIWPDGIIYQATTARKRGEQ